MKTLYLCLFALAALSAGEPSHSIRGLVLDPSNRPVEGARVQCAGHAVFTSNEGRFLLEASDACEASIQKAGFAAATPRLTLEAENRVVLTVLGPTENVIVTATRAQATPEQASVSASTIAERDFAARDYASIPDALRDLPNTAITTTGRRGDQTSLFLRGSSSTSTLVLIDGVPVNDPGGQINLAHLSSAGIERVEVVRGPQSALFGAEASAGAIQIFTKRGDPEATVPHGYFGYERGNFQTDRWLGGLSGGGLGGRLDYSFSGDQFHSAGQYPNDFYRDTTGSTNVGLRLSDQTQIRGILRVYDAHLGTPGQVGYGAYDFAANEETRDITTAARLDDSRGSKYFQTLSVGYHRLHDQFFEEEPYRSQNLAALVRDVRNGQFTDTYFVSLLNPATPPSAGQIPAGERIAKATAYFGPYPSLNLTERTTADYQGTLAQTGGALVFGYGFQHQAANLSGLDVNRDHHGMFMNEQYSLFGGRVYVSGGARVEHSSAFGTEFVPRGGVSLRLASDTFLRVSGGRGITEPSLYENYVVSQYAKGNPALKPEKTNTFEVGLAKQWWRQRVRSEVVYYRSTFQDLITYVYPTWQNIERSWARGIEFSSEARISRNVLLTGSYTRLYTRVVNSLTPNSLTTGIGQQLLRRPKNAGAVALSYTPRRWTFVMGGRLVGDRHDSDYAFGLTRNPGYENVYLSASYTFAKHFTPTLKIDNLLDQRYEEALGYSALSRSVIGGLRIGW